MNHPKTREQKGAGKWRVFTCIFLFQMAALPAIGAAAEKPNVILCMTDDQGWGDVSYNGLQKIKTSNIDSMAQAGLRFNRYYAQQSCSPTRASIMTGLHPFRMGVFRPGMKLRKEELNIAQVMKQSGYATGHFGKWHLNGVSGTGKIIPDSDPLAPQNCGFDESFSVSNYFERDTTFGRNGIAEKSKGDGSDVIVNEALAFIGKAKAQQKPFFAVVWFGSPHSPHDPLPEDLKAAGGSAYYGELLAVDRSIGTLRAGLRTLGLAENTILWFSSDNGGPGENAKSIAPNTNLDLRGHKQEIWEGGLRVPAVIEWPARIKPSVTDMPAGVVDVFPTLVALVDFKRENPVPLDGISLLPLIDGQMKLRPQPMGFLQHKGRPQDFTSESTPSAWTDNQYKLVKTQRDQWELYDLIADRTEKNNIAAEHPDVVSRMKTEMELWHHSVVRSYKGHKKGPAPTE